MANPLVCAWLSVLVGLEKLPADQISERRSTSPSTATLGRSTWGTPSCSAPALPRCCRYPILAPLLQNSPARRWCTCEQVQQLKLHLLSLQSGASQGKMVYLYTAPHAWKRANAAALVGVDCTNGTPAKTLTCVGDRRCYLHTNFSGEGCVPRRSASFRRCS